jgi:hypothetical protein
MVGPAAEERWSWRPGEPAVEDSEARLRWPGLRGEPGDAGPAPPVVLMPMVEPMVEPMERERESSFAWRFFARRFLLSTWCWRSSLGSLVRLAPRGPQDMERSARAANRRFGP